MEGARSARERRASVQLKPSPSRRDALDLSSGEEVEILAAGARAGVVPAEDAVVRAPAVEEPEGYLPLPMLPVRASRNA